MGGWSFFNPLQVDMVWALPVTPGGHAPAPRNAQQWGMRYRSHFEPDAWVLKPTAQGTLSLVEFHCGGAAKWDYSFDGLLLAKMAPSGREGLTIIHYYYYIRTRKRGKDTPVTQLGKD